MPTKNQSYAPLTFAALPADSNSGLFLTCTEGCDGEYSANRSDYFWADRSEPITCSECGAPMGLFRRVRYNVRVK